MDTSVKLKDDLRAVATDIEELLKATAGQTGERISSARDRVEECLRSTREKLEDAGSAAAARARMAALDTDNYVHENAWKTIGVAAGIGVLIGFIMGRR
jgi:ElaB/YqjD/DUF883 family membrane-anchored ribosome-binding protein